MPWVDVPQSDPFWRRPDPSWLKMRIACVTASSVWRVMAKPKRVKKAREGEPPEPAVELATRSNYRKAKIREELTGRSMEAYVSSYMEAGIEMEGLAVPAYEVATDRDCQNGGIFFHDTIPRFAASPDSRVGEDGLLECKYLTGCTTEANHLDLLGGADIPEEYILQMQAQMACSGRQWVDFCSFDPDMPKTLRLYIRRVKRDPTMISVIENEVILFLSQMVEAIQKLSPKEAEVGA